MSAKYNIQFKKDKNDYSRHVHVSSNHVRITTKEQQQPKSHSGTKSLSLLSTGTSINTFNVKVVSIPSQGTDLIWQRLSV
jgi:hypothetical protein